MQFYVIQFLTLALFKSCLFLISILSYFHFIFMHLGGGGALLREKMVEVVSDKFICIVDESKLSKVGEYN